MDINKLIAEFVSKENGEYNLIVPSGKVVTIPAIDFDPMISYVLNRYRIAGKVYKITHQ